jgi:ferritin
MATTGRELLDTSINLELSVARLYRFFAELFPDDHSFWWQLAMEEDNHAALLRSGRDYFLDNNLFPSDILCRSLNDLEESLRKIESFLASAREQAPDLRTALEFSLAIEMSAGEIHYQNFMRQEAHTGAGGIFQELNRDDTDHADRISIYMQKKGFAKKDGL